MAKAFSLAKSSPKRTKTLLVVLYVFFKEVTCCMNLLTIFKELEAYLSMIGVYCRELTSKEKPFGDE